MFGKKIKSQSPVTLPPEPDERTVSIDPADTLAESDSQALSFKGNDTDSREMILKTEEPCMMESDLTASVSRNTLFTGNISSQDNVEIFGEVEGSVTSAAVVKIHGKVHGDVTCGVLIAGNATIIGDINCETSAVFGNDTVVNGNINATVVTVSGVVNGNINASESLSVKNNGAIYGDIATPEIEVSKGAIVFGSVVMEQKEADEPEKESVPAAEESKSAGSGQLEESTAAKSREDADASKQEAGFVASASEAVPFLQQDDPGQPETVLTAHGAGADKKRDGKNEHNPFSLESHNR